MTEFTEVTHPVLATTVTVDTAVVAMDDPMANMESKAPVTNSGRSTPTYHTYQEPGSQTTVLTSQEQREEEGQPTATRTTSLSAIKAENAMEDSTNNKNKKKNKKNTTTKKKQVKKKKRQEGLRKAPGAPRRFKSPYILFSISKMEEYKRQSKQDGETTRVTAISKTIAFEWKTLSKEERMHWDEVALQDKLRYDAEKKLYTGPWQVSSKRSRKDPSAPKRPPSAFLFYCQTQRPKLKTENPDMKNTQISVLLGQKWKNAPEDVRQIHIQRELKEREVYKMEVAKWREQKEAREKLEKEQRKAMTEHYMKNNINTYNNNVSDSPNDVEYNKFMSGNTVPSPSFHASTSSPPSGNTVSTTGCYMGGYPHQLPHQQQEIPTVGATIAYHHQYPTPSSSWVTLAPTQQTQQQNQQVSQQPAAVAFGSQMHSTSASSVSTNTSTELGNHTSPQGFVQANENTYLPPQSPQRQFHQEGSYHSQQSSAPETHVRSPTRKIYPKNPFNSPTPQKHQCYNTPVDEGPTMDHSYCTELIHNMPFVFPGTDDPSTLPIVADDTPMTGGPGGCGNSNNNKDGGNDQEDDDAYMQAFAEGFVDTPHQHHMLELVS